MTETEFPPIDTRVPHIARVYNCLMGGKDNYDVDRELAERMPRIAVTAARQNRSYMLRSTREIVGRRGITQILDVGTGIPAEPNLHTVAQHENPACRIVYVDNDPLVLRHAEALLVGSTPDSVNYLQADIRNPAVILEGARGLLDFNQPIALSLLAVMHFVLDDQDPYGIVRTFMDALPAGSILNLSHSSLENFPEAREEVSATYGQAIPHQLRTRAEVTRFFTESNLSFLVTDGVVPADEWLPDQDVSPQEPSPVYVGTAVKEN